MANTTSLVGGVFIPEIWSAEITRSFENERVMAKLVSRFDADVRSKGDVVHIPNLSSITATYKVQGSEVPSSATTETEVTITVDKWAVARVTVEDILKKQSSYDLMKEYTGKLGQAIAEIQDDDIMSLYTSFSTTIGATSSNVGLAKTYLLGAIRTLDANNVPRNDRHFVVEAYGLEDLRSMDEFVKYDTTGEAGHYGTDARMKFFGVEIHQTNNLPVTTSLVSALMFHREALAMAQQKGINVQSEYSARHLDTALVADILYGVKARRTTAAVRVQYGQV